MRSTQTVILRILVDSEAPEGLRGTLRSIRSDEEHPFVDEQSLLQWLHRLCQEMEPDREVSSLAQDQ